jgi:glucose-specific phosphotransferase system IIA component
MSFFRKKKIELAAPVTGELRSISEVPDKIFSSKAMGDGYSVTPTDGAIYSPLDATVDSVFPTKHAIGLKTKSGVEVLLHLGIDTVELNGQGFTTHVSAGDSVTPETKLVDVDLDFLAQQGKATDIMVIFTNLDKQQLQYTTGDVTASQIIGTLA